MKYWVIDAMDVVEKSGDLEHIVTNIHWKRVAEYIDNDKTCYKEYNSIHKFPEPDNSNFIPYSDLTFEQVCIWLENHINVQRIDEILDKQIADHKSSKILDLPLPWVPAPVVEQRPEAQVEEQAPTQETPTETPSNSL